jgi:hypothetical protein
VTHSTTTLSLPPFSSFALTLATVHPLTTIYNNGYLPTNTWTIQLPIIYILPTCPEGLGEVVTTMGDSTTTFSVIWDNAVVQFTYLHLQLVEGRFGF